MIFNFLVKNEKLYQTRMSSSNRTAKDTPRGWTRQPKFTESSFSSTFRTPRRSKKTARFYPVQLNKAHIRIVKKQRKKMCTFWGRIESTTTRSLLSLSKRRYQLDPIRTQLALSMCQCWYYSKFYLILTLDSLDTWYQMDSSF